MSPGVLRGVLIVVSLAMLAEWPVPVLIGSWVVVIWLVPRWYGERLELIRLREGDPILEMRVLVSDNELQAAREKAAQLETALALARQQVNRLQTELQHARSGKPWGKARSESSSTGNTGSGDPLYRRVGLDPAAPDWLIEVVQREYRKRLRPDPRPQHQKQEATRRFQEAEVTFAEIHRTGSARSR